MRTLLLLIMASLGACHANQLQRAELLSLSLKVIPPDKVTAGETLEVLVEVRNTGNVTITYCAEPGAVFMHTVDGQRFYRQFCTEGGPMHHAKGGQPCGLVKSSWWDILSR